MLLETLSVGLLKALQSGNSQANAFAGFDPLYTVPSGDGVYTAGAPEGQVAPQRVFLLPYGEGGLGSQFSMRVYGWKGMANQLNNNKGFIEIPFLLAEFLCTLCNRAGVRDYALNDAERLCDTMSLTQGSLGVSTLGEVVSAGPGSDLIAFAMLDLRGCKRFQFDFAFADTSNPVGMNCLWSRA